MSSYHGRICLQYWKQVSPGHAENSFLCCLYFHHCPDDLYLAVCKPLLIRQSVNTRAHTGSLIWIESSRSTGACTVDTCRIIYVLEWRTVDAHTRELFWFLFPELCCNQGNNHKITLEWAHKQFVTRVLTLFYFLHDITNPQMPIYIKTTIFTHRLCVSLARFTFCWWRQNWLLMT